MAKGQIVCSKAGRDKGKFLAVVGCETDALLVCDGKERPLERPKRKNRKHLTLTNHVLCEAQLATNKALRRALREFSGAAGEKEGE